MPTFREYLVRCLHGATQTGLTNPLVRMPVRRFRELTPDDLEQVQQTGRLVVGTLADPITRNLERNYQTRIRERGEHCAYVARAALRCRRDDSKEELLPILLRKVGLTRAGDRVTAVVDEDEEFRLNPLIRLKFHDMGIEVPADLSPDSGAARWVQAQIGNRGQVEDVSYIGLFSSQQMLMQERFEETVVCTSLAANAGVRARLSGQPVVIDVDNNEITDEGLEDLGTVLPTDDSQLRAIQLVDRGGYLSRYFPSLAHRMDSFEQCVRACLELERQLPSTPKWVEKARWNRRVASLPEVKELWRRTVAGEVPLSKSREVFCYSLLHQLRPADCLHGAELGQVLGEFRQCDEELSSWSVARLQSELASREGEAARRFAAQKADLEKKAGQMRPRGTLRELLTKNYNYLLTAASMLPSWVPL